MRYAPKKDQGLTLIELLVALSLLATVVATFAHIAVQLMMAEALSASQMQALDLVRKSTAEHNAGVALGANSTVTGEGGTRLQLAATESADSDLGISRRTQSVLSIDPQGNAVQQLFEGSVRLVARPHLEALPADDISATSAASVQQITATTGAGNGYVMGAGAYPHGTLATILARPAPGNHFVKWSGAVVTNTTSAATFILANDDKTVRANFDVGAGAAGGILFTPADLGQISWSGVYTNTGGTGLFTYSGHHYRIQQVTTGFYQSWGTAFVTANVYVDTITRGTQSWPQIGIFSTSDATTYAALTSRTPMLTATAGYAPYQAVVGPSVYQIAPPAAGPNPAVVLTLPSNSPAFGTCSGWLVMQLD